MIQTDPGQAGDPGRLDDIGRVPSAAQTRLKADQPTARGGKAEESQCRHQFKFGGIDPLLRLKAVRRPLDLLRLFSEQSVGQRFAVHRDPLAEPLDKGGDEQSGADARLGEDRGDHRRDTALSVGSCDVDKLQLILRIVQPRHQPAHRIGIFLFAQPFAAVQPVNRLKIGHNMLLFLLHPSTVSFK